MFAAVKEAGLGDGTLTITPTNVLVVSESRLHREGLALRLSVEPGIDAVGASESIGGAVEFIGDHEVDVVLVDALPTRRNLEELTAAVRTAPGIHFVALAAADSESEIVAWAEAGCAGVVDRNGSPLELKGVLEAVTRGELPCSPRIAGVLLRRVRALARRWRPLEGIGRLTQRERDVLTLIGHGMSNKQIALRLGLQVPTVKNHIRSIFEKLEVSSRAMAVSFALSLGPPESETEGRAPDL
jgi:DNA-binding NarL/FixJ family response regulator